DDVETPAPTPAQMFSPGQKVPIGGPAGDLLRRRIDGLHGPGLRPGIPVTAGHQTPPPPPSAAPTAATPTPAPVPAGGNTHAGVAPTPVPVASGNGDVSIGGGLIETNPKASKPLP